MGLSCNCFANGNPDPWAHASLCPVGKTALVPDGQEISFEPVASQMTDDEEAPAMEIVLSSAEKARRDRIRFMNSQTDIRWERW